MERLFTKLKKFSSCFPVDPTFCGPPSEWTEPPAHDELRQLQELHSPEQFMDPGFILVPDVETHQPADPAFLYALSWRHYCQIKACLLF